MKHSGSLCLDMEYYCNVFTEKEYNTGKERYTLFLKNDRRSGRFSFTVVLAGVPGCFAALEGVSKVSRPAIRSSV